MAKMKLFPKRNKNLLPLLAVTVLVLSFALVNYSEFLSSKVENTQSVLSKSDEKRDENEEQDKVEEKKQERERTETKNEEKKEVKEEVKKEISSGRIKIDPIITVKRSENTENETEVEDENETEDEDSIEDADDNEVETEFEQESETASSDGTVNKFKLKIKTRTVAGKTIIETASGEMEVENSPEEAVNSLVENEVLDTPTSFEAKTNDNNKVEFEVQGIEAKKLLGLFAVNLPKTVTVDAETGEVTSSNQNVWTRFLSLLSI
jgi:hypothetical protein